MSGIDTTVALVGATVIGAMLAGACVYFYMKAPEPVVHTHVHTIRFPELPAEHNGNNVYGGNVADIYEQIARSI